jgi:hypothetical protein
MLLNIILWVVQAALASMFAYAGYIKIAKPIPEIESWSRLSEQIFRVDTWSVCGG